MARPPSSRHSKTRKDPVTIELEADAVSRVDNKESSGAEAVKPAMVEEAQQAEESAKATESEAAAAGDETSEAEAAPAADAGSPATETPPEERTPFEDETAGGYRSFENTTDFGRDESNNTSAGESHSGLSRRSGISGLVVGLIGGLIALIGAGALQVAGILPSPGGSGGANAETVSALQTEIATLREQVSSLQAGGGDGAGVQKALGETNDKVDGLATALEQVKSDITNLRSAMEAGGGRADGAGLERINARIAEIDKAVAALREGGGAPTADLAALGERLSAAESAANAAANAASASDNRLADLEKSLGTLQQSVAGLSKAVEAQASQPKVALSIAVSALKAAVDAGGTFTSEVEAFAAAAPNAPELAELRSLAARGVPSRAEIAAEAPAAAQAMIDAGRVVDENAGFVDRLMSSARSLVKIRPVGPVEGTGVPETVARMETAIRSGDFPRAMAEYDTLPEGPKAAGRALADKIRARLSAEQLVEKATAGALKAA